MRTLRSGAQDYDVDGVSRETARIDDEVDMCIATGMRPDRLGSRTVQSGKDDADINVIVRRFGVTGQMPAGVRLPSYGDYNGVDDFQSAMNIVRQAEEAFMTLRSDIRAKFGNDPQAFLEYCSDPENIGELRKMGLANPEVIADNIPVPPIPAGKQEKDDGRSKSGAGKAGKASEGSKGDSGGKSEGSGGGD